MFGPFPRLFRVLNKHNFLFYRRSGMCVSLSISSSIRLRLFGVVSPCESGVSSDVFLCKTHPKPD